MSEVKPLSEDEIRYKHKIGYYATYSTDGAEIDNFLTKLKEGRG